jgi:hypothetical protein
MTVRTVGWARRSASVAWVVAIAAVLLAGCGAPAYTYVTNAAEHTYLKVPSAWQPINQKELEGALGVDPGFPAADQGLWLVAYDAAATPSLSHLLGAQAEVPAVLAGVKDLPTSARGQVSFDNLRDFFFPVSPTGRQADAADPTSQRTGFQLFADEVLTPGKGVRGVHVVYRYSFAGGPPQMFDQTTYVNDDASKIYMFFVRCSTECYTKRQEEIRTVVSSFTVQEKT